MATLASAQAKWERRTSNAGQRWKDAVAGAGNRWSAALSAFGAPVGANTLNAYNTGVGAVSAADFQAAIQGKGNKWAENMRRGLSA